MKTIEQEFLDGLVGMDVATATSQVEDLGWESFPYQQGQPTVAVMMGDTVMLTFDDDHKVVRAYPCDQTQLAA